jgi:DNA-binding MarR family transcriptional regulator
MGGGEVALRLLGAFRGLVDDLHAELARRGHPDVRPGHGFALQALGPRPITASALADRLGVTKQAAGKTVDVLEARGWVARTDDPDDARRRLLVLTAPGRALLSLSGEILDQLCAERRAAVGADDFAAFERALRSMTRTDGAPVDALGWLSS